MENRTFAKSTEETFITFHTGRGGMYNNPGHVSYIDQDVPIDHYTDDLFIGFENTRDIIERFKNKQVRNAIIEAIDNERFETLKDFGVELSDLGEKQYYDASGSPSIFKRGETVDHEAEANAKLIAAAPDLLENLKNILFVFRASAESEMQKAAIKYADEVIKKATE